MKKVTGTSSAVAIVAVRPGTAPTNRPNSAEPQDHHEHVGIEDQRRRPAPGVAHGGPQKANAFAARPRAAARAAACRTRSGSASVSDDGQRHARAPAHARARASAAQDRQCGEDEAEPVDREDVEQQSADDQQATPQGARRERSQSRQREPGAAASRERLRTIRSAPQHARPTPTMPGNSAGPTCWPGIAGKPCDVPEHAPREQQRAAPPTASLSFIVRTLTWRCRPPSSSRRGRRRTSAMNLPKSSGSAQTTPKPRLAMKSLYSLPSSIFLSAATSSVRTSAGMPLGAAMPRQARDLPVAAGRRLQRRHVRVERGRRSRP